MFVRPLSRISLTTAAALAICLAQQPSADAAVTFDWAAVGNAGNAADNTGFGGVSYEYRIATTEVTNGQYAEFLNAVAGSDPFGLYNSDMAGTFGGITRSGSSGSYSYAAIAGRENTPVTQVTWYDAARFINWLHNGQGNGGTESGAYNLLGGTETPSNGGAVTRQGGAQFFLPSEDEWYKAAYHDVSAGTAGTYYTYANGSDKIPISDQPGDNPAAVNFFRDDFSANRFNDGYAVGGSNAFPTDHPYTDAGAYAEAQSPYGTLDQNGNVWEWTESFDGANRVFRGGSAFNTEFILRADIANDQDGGVKLDDLGFRVASQVPEPGSFALIAIGTSLMLRRNRG